MKFYAPGRQGRFWNEVSWDLRLEGVARLVAFGIEVDRPFLVREWVEGRTLREVLKSQNDIAGIMEAAVAVRGLCRVCRALHSAATPSLELVGVQHGRLQSGNVLVDDSGAIHLINFDYAAGIVSEAKRASLTVTPLGMPPADDLRCVEQYLRYLAPNWDRRIEGRVPRALRELQDARGMELGRAIDLLDAFIDELAQ